MTCPYNSEASHPPRTNNPLRGSPISKPQYLTCHIGCQPLSLSSPKCQAPHTGPHHLCQLPAPLPQGRARKGPEHPPPLPQLRLRILNTSSYSTIRVLARPSVTPRSTPPFSPTPMKPENSGRGGPTSTPSPPATSTPTMCSPPPRRKLPLAQARAPSPRTKLGSCLPRNTLRAPWPLLLKRGPQPSQAPNDISWLLARPVRPTQTLALSPLPFLTSLRASFATLSAYSLSASPLLLTPWCHLPNRYRQSHSSRVVRLLLRFPHQGTQPVVPGWRQPLVHPGPCPDRRSASNSRPSITLAPTTRRETLPISPASNPQRQSDPDSLSQVP